MASLPCWRTACSASAWGWHRGIAGFKRQTAATASTAIVLDQSLFKGGRDIPALRQMLMQQVHQAIMRQRMRLPRARTANLKKPGNERNGAMPPEAAADVCFETPGIGNQIPITSKTIETLQHRKINQAGGKDLIGWVWRKSQVKISRVASNGRTTQAL